MFEPLLRPGRYKGAHGGRGSGKSHFFAGCAVERGIWVPGTRGVCIREVQRSLRESSKRLIEDKIRAMGVERRFRVLDAEIRTPGDGIIIFQGMNGATEDSIKSLEGYDWAWVAEAQTLSQRSLDLLRPTIRKPGSELWFDWNPESDDDPVDALLRGPKPPRDANVVAASYADNPWFPQVLRDEMEQDRERDFDKFSHVWLGGYLTISEARIFKGRVSVEEFEEPEGIRPYYGADWGFANDPTALVRCYIVDEVLYVTHEAFGWQVEIDDTPALFDTVPGSRDWPIKGDSARPETISYILRRGFSISAAKKWKGCVEDGVSHLKGFRRIVVHPRCVHLINEFRLYSYKVDKHTDEILPIIVDAWNHGMDALRYALDGIIQARGGLGMWERLAG